MLPCKTITLQFFVEEVRVFLARSQPCFGREVVGEERRARYVGMLAFGPSLLVRLDFVVYWFSTQPWWSAVFRRRDTHTSSAAAGARLGKMFGQFEIVRELHRILGRPLDQNSKMRGARKGQVGGVGVGLPS